MTSNLVFGTVQINIIVIRRLISLDSRREMTGGYVKVQRAQAAIPKS